MKRRTFLASLFALPFAAKPLEALTPKPTKISRDEIGRLIDSEIAKLMKGAAGAFDIHKQRINQNTKAIQALTDALIHSPSGFKGGQYRYIAQPEKK